MPDFDETGVNEEVDDAPPASPIDDGSLEDALRASIGQPSPAEGQQTSPQGGDDPAGDQGQSLIEPNPDAPADKQLPETVPYVRHSQTIAQLRETEKREQEWQRAAKLGYDDVGTMRAEEKMALEAGHASLEAGKAWQHDQITLRNYAQQLSERIGLSDEDREEMFQARQTALDAKRLLALSEENNQFTTSTLKTQAISAIESDLGTLDTELKDYLSGLKLAEIPKWHAAMKRQIQSYADGEVSRSVDKRKQNGRVAAPMGAGGSPSQPQGGAPRTMRENVSRTLDSILREQMGSFD